MADRDYDDLAAKAVALRERTKAMHAEYKTGIAVLSKENAQRDKATLAGSSGRLMSALR